MKLGTLIVVAMLSIIAMDGPAQSQTKHRPIFTAATVTAVQDSTLEIAGDIKYAPYKLVKLTAKGLPEKAAVRWRINPGKDVQRATSPRGLLEFVAPPGTYEVELEVISGSVDAGLQFDSAFAVVTIEGPTPPGPGPGPNPPGPNPPNPTDPLVAELKVLYLADTSATKQADLMLLVELYRQAAILANANEVTTLSGLAQRVAGAGASLLTRDRLAALRTRIAEFVVKEFGDQEANLTPELRAKTSATYARIHAALKQIGG